MQAGPFTVAAVARLTRVTQGKRLFTLREKCLRRNIMRA
jgi:hypothetical protein